VERRMRWSGGCGIRTREGVNPTRFPSLPLTLSRSRWMFLCGPSGRDREPCAPEAFLVDDGEQHQLRLKLRLESFDLVEPDDVDDGVCSPADGR
jgi:hypothetical protein